MKKDVNMIFVLFFSIVLSCIVTVILLRVTPDGQIILRNILNNINKLENFIY